MLKLINQYPNQIVIKNLIVMIVVLNSVQNYSLHKELGIINNL